MHYVGCNYVDDLYVKPYCTLRETPYVEFYVGCNYVGLNYVGCNYVEDLYVKHAPYVNTLYVKNPT